MLSEGVVVFDEHLKIKEINYVAAKLFGLARKKILGCEIAALVNKANKPLIQQCRELILSARVEKSIVTDSFSLEKKRIWLDLIATPTTLILQDKSSQYHVLELGKDFVANASHELRTPITIIRGFAETLQDLGDVSSEMLRDITDKILKSCERMDRLVKNLLKLADIENLPLVHRQNCRLDLLLESCKSNLLENSVKYSKPPAHITMILSKKKDCAVISIKDRGIGIPESDRLRIFEKFYTVDKTHSRKLGGAGLGLSIVKTIVDKHEGSISVSSEVGKGSCFTLELPIC